MIEALFDPSDGKETELQPGDEIAIFRLLDLVSLSIERSGRKLLIKSRGNKSPGSFTVLDCHTIDEAVNEVISLADKAGQNCNTTASQLTAFITIM